MFKLRLRRRPSLPVMLGLLLVAGVVVVMCPIATIGALNTLFPPLSIPYTWKTWLAVAWFGIVLSARASSQ